MGHEVRFILYFAMNQ